MTVHDEYQKVRRSRTKIEGTNMLSTKYRLRLESICKSIANNEEVKLEDMIWAEKLAKAHTTCKRLVKQSTSSIKWYRRR